mgnify:CR=1 FL=1
MMPIIQWVIFDKIVINIDISIILFATILICIYNRYMQYVKYVYGITDRINNKVIDKLPKVMITVLILFAILMSINCRWI